MTTEPITYSKAVELTPCEFEGNPHTSGMGRINAYEMSYLGEDYVRADYHTANGTHFASILGLRATKWGDCEIIQCYVCDDDGTPVRCDKDFFRHWFNKYLD